VYDQSALDGKFVRQVWNGGVWTLASVGQNSGLPRTDVPPGSTLGAARRQSREGVLAWLFSYTGKVGSLWKWNF